MNVSFKMFLRISGRRIYPQINSIHLKSKRKAETILLIPRSLDELSGKMEKFRRGLYENGDIYDDYLATIEITFTHDAIASVSPPLRGNRPWHSPIPWVEQLQLVQPRFTNDIFGLLLRSLSKQLAHNLSLSRPVNRSRTRLRSVISSQSILIGSL